VSGVGRNVEFGGLVCYENGAKFLQADGQCIFLALAQQLKAHARRCSLSPASQRRWSTGSNPAEECDEGDVCWEWVGKHSYNFSTLSECTILARAQNLHLRQMHSAIAHLNRAHV
jgi:hypothetical protein